MSNFTRLFFNKFLLIPILLVVFGLTKTYGQVTVYNESFDAPTGAWGTLPAGWNTSTYTQTSGSSGYGPWGRDYAYPCVSPTGNYGYYPEGGSYFSYSGGTTSNPYTYGTPYGHNSSSCGSGYLWYNCYYNYPGSYAVAASPAINFNSAYTGAGGFLLSFWVWQYNVSYNNKLDVYINTSPSLTGAVQLGGDIVPYSVTGTIGAWYNYTYSLPSSFNTSNAVYIIYRAQVGTGTYTYDVLVDDVNVTYVPPCSGTPSAPTISSSPLATAVCPGTTISIAATDPNLTPGISFNWQSAPTATGPWTNVSAGNGNGTLTYNVPGVTDTTYFRVVDSCQISHTNVPSTNVYRVPVTKYSLPYLETFNSYTNNTVPPCYTVNDNYGVNWAVINGLHAADHTVMTAMRISDPATNAAHGKNNFFTLPGFTLTGSQVYAIRFKYARARRDAIADTGALYPEHLQVFANSPSAAFSVPGVTGGTLLFDQTITFNNVADTTLYFAPPTSGSYYFSWYSNTPHPGGATSTVAGGHLIVDSVYVGPSPCVAPGITSPTGPSVVNACIGGPASVTVTATGTANTFQWYNSSTSLPITGATAAALTFPSLTTANAGTYYVVITNPCGTTTSQNITLNANPIPATGVTPTGPTTFCAGTFFSLNGPAASGNLYQWNSASGPITGATSQNYTPTTSGTYSVTVTSSANCTATSPTTAVTVNPVPAATITPAGPTSFCNGGSVALIANTGAGLTYQWYDNNIGIPPTSGGTAVTYNAAPPNAGGIYKVVVTNAYNCSATSANTVVTSSAPPSAVITTAGGTSICSGSSLTLSVGTGAGYKYQWQLNGNNVNDTLSTYSATNSGSYSVTVTSGACSNTSAPVNVNVIPSPPAYVTPVTTTVICSGKYIVLYADTAATATTYTYQWNRNGSFTGVTTYIDTITTIGNYTVRVTNSSNCSTLSPITPVNIIALPPATITISGSDTICSGNTVTLTAPAGPGYTYQWLGNAAGIIPTATGEYFAASAADSYKVVVTDLNFCVDTTTVGQPVVVNPAPAINIVAPSTSFCPGGSAVLSASPGAGSGLTYQWFFSGTNTGVTAATYTATATGIVTVKATNAQGCSATSTGVNTTLNTPPSATIQASGPLNFCPGSNVVLSTSVGPYTYLWKNRAGAILSTASTYTAVSTDSITVTVTNIATGCFATTPTPVAVVLNSSPAATIASTGITTICSGNSVTLTADTNSSAGITYQWLYNGSAIGGATARTHTVSVGGNYAVTTSNGNCTTTSTPIAITVNATPTAAITPLSNINICANNYTSLSASAIGAGLTYSWSRNGHTLTTTGSTSPVYTTDSAGNYTLSITSSQGCSATSAPVTVNVYPVPVINLVAATSTTACQGDTVRLYASTNNTGLAYTWVRGTTALSTAISNTFGAANTGNYYVIATNTSHCSDTSANIAVTIHPVPTPVIAQAGAVLSTGTFSTYQWYYNNTAISGAKGSSYTATRLGNYTVFVTDNNSCAAMSSTYNVTSLSASGVNSVANSMDIKLYPNPTTSIVHIEAPIEVNAKISSLDGRILMQAQHAIQIDLSQLANGVYMISLYDANGTLVKIDKLVKSGN